MDLGLKGKVAVVTAASRGMGKAVALELAREGANVAICSRSEIEIATAATEIESLTGRKVIHAACDVTSAEDIEGVIETVTTEWGGIDILVANAGGPPSGSFFSLSDDDWLRAFQLTLMSVVRLVRQVAPSMRERGGGRIVVITSSSVKQPIPNLLLSNALRPGVLGLIKSLANELALDGILVNNFSPGRINTERLQQNDKGMAERRGVPIDEIQKASWDSIPLGRYGSVDEIASVITFMVSERASYITGTTIVADGGYIKALH